MESSSGHDLFEGFNGREVSEVLRRCTNCGRFVLIGPPRSGKTFFRENYLKGVTVVEHTLGITTTAETESEEAEGESGLQKVMGLLKRMVPIIGMFTDKERVKDEELRRVLGDWAPKHVVEWAKRVIGDSPHRAYYIEWKCVEEPNACTSDADAVSALKLIKEVFDDRKVRIRWFKAEYVPPGLVEEVIELVREKGEDGARRVLKGWVDAYFKAVGTLREVLGLKENLLEWDELSIGLLSEFINNSAKYVIAGLTATPLMVAVISVLTHMAFKKEGMNYLQEIVELWRGLNGLSVKGSDGKLDFNELGRLLVYRVAYAMGMSYDEAKEALMGITGLSVKDLEERVKEIEGKIEELEKKFESFRQEVRAGIETADVGEFAKGGIYLNIEVEDDGLRICAEGQCYNIVRAGKFNELVGEIKNKLLNQDFVVVVGPKGIGKSTLAAAVIWKLLVNGYVGRVARVDVLNKENYKGFERFLRNYSREFTNYFDRLLILYDPVSTETYERADIDAEAPIQKNIERTIKDLMIAIKSISSKAPKPLALIVIPSDLYNALSEEIRNELKKYRLDVSQGLVSTEFLAELIREYTRTSDKPSGCKISEEEVSKLAGKVAGFDSGHALIARLIGEELARSNCSAREIEELISKAKGKAERFIILHINGLFKIHEDPDTAKALAEIFALRRPFVDLVRPGGPILTPGIIELIGEKRSAKTLYGAEGKELRSWLALRQHDLIEEAIEKLLKCIASEGEECEELGDASDPWIKTHAPKIRSRTHAVKYFARKYGKRFVKKLRRHKNCWKRAALIIGHASAGRVSVLRHEDLSESLRRDIAESLGDALKRCGVDDYLLVGNKIPPLIWYLTKHHAYALAEAFVDKYDKAVAEIKRVLNIVRKRGRIYDAEGFYGLGLASIIAKAVEPGKPIEPGDAGAVLHIVSSIVSLNIQHARSLSLVKPMLIVLVPLRDKAPQKYLEVLAFALDRVSGPDILFFTCSALDTVMYILNELDYIFNKYGDGVKGRAWILVRAIGASINSLYGCLLDCDDYKDYWDAPFRTKLERIARRVADLLNEVDRLNPSLDIFAWAHASLPALKNKCVRALMESVLGIDVVNKKVKEIAGGLSRLSETVQELIRDEDFMGFVESWLGETSEKAARRIILKETSNLKYAWALYKLNSDELYEAEELFNKAARERWEIGDYERYLDYSNWALRAKAIRSKLAGDELVELVNGFRQLYEEAKKQSDTGALSTILSNILGGYLVSLALKGGDEEIRRIEELLREKCREPERILLDLDLIRPTLYALLGLRDESSGELKDRLCVKPEIRFVIYEPEHRYIKSQGDIRQALINYFQRWISNEEVLDLLKKLDLDAESLKNELEGLIHELSGKSLPELVMFCSYSEREQRHCLSAHLTYMLYALIDGNEKLAKAHALYGAASVAGKLPARLFLEAYKECCDLKSESFRRAIARLFFLHI